MRIFGAPELAVLPAEVGDLVCQLLQQRIWHMLRNNVVVGFFRARFDRSDEQGRFYWAIDVCLVESVVGDKDQE